jgi:hypothetical protein
MTIAEKQNMTSTEVKEFSAMPQQNRRPQKGLTITEERETIAMPDQTIERQQEGTTLLERVIIRPEYKMNIIGR